LKIKGTISVAYGNRPVARISLVMGHQFWGLDTLLFSPSLETVVQCPPTEVFEILHCWFTNWFLVNAATTVA